MFTDGMMLFSLWTFLSLKYSDELLNETHSDSEFLFFLTLFTSQQSKHNKNTNSILEAS